MIKQLVLCLNTRFKFKVYQLYKKKRRILSYINVHTSKSDIHLRLTTYAGRGLETSEGSIPSIGFRAEIGLLMIHFLFHCYRPVPIAG